jgi:hypothetical protein
MSSRDPKEQENQKADKRQGGNVETKGASKAPPSGDRADQSSGATPTRPSGEGQPSTGEAGKKN